MNETSARGCGCDPGCNWLCQDHAGDVAKDAYAEEVQHMGVLVMGGYDGEGQANTEASSPPTTKRYISPRPLSAEDEEIIMTVEERMRLAFPNGHKHYLPVVLKQLQLHSDKSGDYAAGGHVFGNFQRVAAILSNYPNLKLSDQRVIALVYALKQIDAVLWGINANITHKVEGLASRLDDIAVYVTIVQCMDREAK